MDKSFEGGPKGTGSAVQSAPTATPQAQSIGNETLSGRLSPTETSAPINNEFAFDSHNIDSLTSSKFASGREPADNILNSVKSQGVDNTFEQLAEGKIGPENTEKPIENKPQVEPDTAPKQKPVVPANQEPKKLDQEEEEPEIEPQEEGEDILRQLIEKIKLLEAINRRLMEEMEKMQKQLEQTQELALNSADQVHALTKKQGEITKNEAVRDAIIVDFRQKTKTAA